MLHKTKKLLLIAFLLLGIAVSLTIAYQTNILFTMKVATFAPELREVSGIEFDKKGRLWAINDGGDGPHLYKVAQDGSVERKVKISNGRNLDWEDMTQDDFGHFFIGDFGNNDHIRKWLTIYKIENPIDIKTETTEAEIIKFQFPKDILTDDHELNKNHDLEAFVYYQGQLFLFTKNRNEEFDGKTHLFKIGDHAANFKADYVSSYVTCTQMQKSCWITSAALSPKRDKLALLDSKRVWLFTEWQGDNFFSGNVYKIDLGLLTQKESVTFYDNDTLVFTDEEYYGVGRNAYKLDLSTADKELIKKADAKTGLFLHSLN
ncbi:hypothetical protein HR060_02695 [Catenovulum sp. SM1970]|uniref:hypothetical protein n=1 Tax=Marinifaba aquimaris TaxID=2741323 RepID=UPI0015719D9E|nr:hypothetical protein [Marinifaba aquimaris]NTS75764.1 hypothetical protein [Marinifaba aquimaris]